MKVVITGSLAFDFIMDFPGKFADHIIPGKIHSLNLSFLVKTISQQMGGTAGNIAYNLALLGLRPTILATAGNDFAPYKKFLEASGVDTSMITVTAKEPTGRAFIFTDMADNQISGFYSGAMRAAAKLKIKSADFVVIAPNEPRAMINFVRQSQLLGLAYLFDPGMQLPRLEAEDLKTGIEGAKIVIGSDYEMALIYQKLKIKNQKRPSLAKASEGKQIWITTLGKEGSIIEADGKVYKIPPAKPKRVLDPTGAGDAYRAGFLAGFLRGLPLSVCGRMGSVAAVYTVEKYGTTTHKFTLAEFKKRYQENFKEELTL